MSEHAQESFLGMKVLKTLGQDKEDIEVFNTEVEKQVKNNRRVAHYDAMFDPLATIAVSISLIAMIIIGSNLVINKQISLGDLITFNGYIFNLIWPMFAMGQLFNMLERGNSSYDRIQEILNEKPLIVDSPNAIKTIKTGDLHIKIASFAYPDDPKPVLNNIDITLKNGKTLGLVGPVGSGKSTVLKLLLRDFDDYKGEITYNGKDIKNYQLKTYLNSIGYVAQDNFLFSTTIKENIAFINPKLPLTEVRKYAKIAALDADVENMPKKYETVVGENGISLSGGQRQRLSIARALIVKPKVLILDDALSAVDAKTEKEILGGLKTNDRNQTTIVSASRISSVIEADEILVFKNGKIIERGTHRQLLKKKGWYAKTFEQQQLASKFEKNLEDKSAKGGVQ
jgi:ATP-binding cassette subfamily B protein/ATP-binding cassette subfamily C protein